MSGGKGRVLVAASVRVINNYRINWIMKICYLVSISFIFKYIIVAKQGTVDFTLEKQKNYVFINWSLQIQSLQNQKKTNTATKTDSNFHSSRI